MPVTHHYKIPMYCTCKQKLLQFMQLFLHLTINFLFIFVYSFHKAIHHQDRCQITIQTQFRTNQFLSGWLIKTRPPKALPRPSIHTTNSNAIKWCTRTVTHIEHTTPILNIQQNRSTTCPWFYLDKFSNQVGHLKTTQDENSIISTRLLLKTLQSINQDWLHLDEESRLKIYQFLVKDSRLINIGSRLKAKDTRLFFNKFNPLAVIEIRYF